MYSTDTAATNPADQCTITLNTAGVPARRPSNRLLRAVCTVAVFLLTLPFESCGLFGNTTAILLTDKPDFAAYIELFNAGQEEYRIELRYHENPSMALDEPESMPDLVVGEGLASMRTIGHMASLDQLFEDGLVDPTIFYPALLEHGFFEEAHHLLPVSFNLPAIMYTSETGGNTASEFSLSLDEVREKSIEYNETEQPRVRVLGFSPRWNPETLYLIARLFGADFRESPTGYVRWNERHLAEAVEYASSWTVEVNGGTEAEQAFTDKYLYEPGYELVVKGRIRFFLTTIRDYFIIPAETRKRLTFSWLSDDRKIPTCDAVVHMGLTRESRNRKPAEAFMRWFFKRETQRRIIDSVQYKRIRTFGISEGFSSIQAVNEIILPGYYPVLAGHIPPAESLAFPPVMPRDWERAKREVVVPWFMETVEGSDEPLTDRLRRWLHTTR
jgi:hypothetical protein